VSGSLPSCSVVVPEEVVVAATGNVTGIGTVQVLLSAVTVTSVMDRPSLDKVYERLGLHWLEGENIIVSIQKELVY
jgi:hypothetical protein